ncbi:bifunctional alpha,alpha-trehalose-phosphate synthase (UDP-forming)/trehalose-phosphatase [Caldisericum exile]|uniref:Alpha,alpha-trehalose-phosphate synthase/trehalose-phosphatase n=1 Tax=Caldisericum exile (strain DSM 21853 / NBRC 104410 / AZM16c01) TaxID=511051 RepID=A0A7U6JGT4_CALEA|nr:bifunctional alpha,alpha-trehalose-phosphate synthase (UDP-forming)/trehalose-phosphatase [Caldisericum exile]BAL80797.1 alpha,alpha-trehalose-phosphate synthase/trehalose-phosphatase [Caldisericum exile AZM16c01]
MKLIIASNRLPVYAVKEGDSLIFKQSPGGLVQGLSASIGTILEITESKDYFWIGWPGETIEEVNQERVYEYLLKTLNAIPVFLSKEEMEKFYLGFCNSTLWPIFHSFPSFAKFKRDEFERYIEVNKKFAETALKILDDDDLLWIHDYHLMLLPSFIKKEKPNVLVGFFLHIPFPPYEIFKLMPKNMRETILEGVLNADLIGFHTYQYQQNFIKTVRSIFSIEHDIKNIYIDGRRIRTDVFPISIDFDKYNKAEELPEIKKRVAELKNLSHNSKVVLSIDRLDYSKGIVNRLFAVERFLEKYPEFHKNVLFIVVVVPSRIGVEKYNETKEYIDSLIGKINGRFSTIDWSPIQYLFKNLPFEELVPLYILGDALLVTSLADGMNLVSKEYIAANPKGALILSELTGAAEDLRRAFIINPNDIEGIADTLKEALSLSKDELFERNKIMVEYLKKNDIKKWTTSFLEELSQCTPTKKPIYLDEKNIEELKNQFLHAKRKAIILDYDGTLVGFDVDRSKTLPSKEVLDLLDGASRKGIFVAISSGRTKTDLDKFFPKGNFTLIAERGAFIKEKDKDWEKTFEWVDASFKKDVLKILTLYKDRIPNSSIEEKEFSIVFHVRASPTDTAELALREMLDILIQLTAQTNAYVTKINKGIEIKAQELNKGIFVSRIAKEGYDFAIIAGDDYVDEEAFKVGNKYGYFTLKVGSAVYTKAKYFVNSPEELLKILKLLSKSLEEKPKEHKLSFIDYIKSLFKI